MQWEAIACQTARVSAQVATVVWWAGDSLNHGYWLSEIAEVRVPRFPLTTVAPVCRMSVDL